MPITPRSDKQQLADLLLSEPVEDWIIRRRPGTTWRKIAAELTEATGGKIDITDVTVRAWVADQFPIEPKTRKRRTRRRAKPQSTPAVTP